MVDRIFDYLGTLNWNGINAFVAAALVIFLVLRKWLLASLVIITVVIAEHVGKVSTAVFSLNTAQITVSTMVYVLGALVIAVVAFMTMFEK